MPLNAAILKAHLNPAFVETGTYIGEGVEAALAAGFDLIWTVDIDPERAAVASRAFVRSPKPVAFESGDSALFLSKMVPTLTTPTTFWLDAHPVGYFELLQPDLPLVNELLAISFTPRRPGDIILIDDIRLFSEGDRARLEGLIKLLWPKCSVDLIDSSIIPRDIMRATGLA